MLPTVVFTLPVKLRLFTLFIQIGIQLCVLIVRLQMAASSPPLCLGALYSGPTFARWGELSRRACSATVSHLSAWARPWTLGKTVAHRGRVAGCRPPPPASGNRACIPPSRGTELGTIWKLNFLKSQAIKGRQVQPRQQRRMVSFA